MTYNNWNSNLHSTIVISNIILKTYILWGLIAQLLLKYSKLKKCKENVVGEGWASRLMGFSYGPGPTPNLLFRLFQPDLKAKIISGFFVLTGK